MEQPLFSCTRCLKSFPHSQMSRSGTTCKVCTPHHSSFKQCEYCRSDFKYSLPGAICPRCQSSKSKYGDPKPCTICLLPTAYGSALVCQRCLHYRNKFGDPRQCQNCLQMSAFYKDEISRSKVDGQVLCWVCTYNFKMTKSKESKSERSQSKTSSYVDSYSKASHDLSGLDAIKRQRTEDYTLRHSVTRQATNNYSLDSAYNEHLLTIGQLQDDLANLKRQLAQRDSELLAKDRVIAGLKSDLDDYETQQRERIIKAQHMAADEINKLKENIRNLQREKNELMVSVASTKKRKMHGHGSTSTSSAYASAGATVSPLTLSPLRVPPARVHSAKSSFTLAASASTPSLSLLPTNSKRVSSTKRDDQDVEESGLRTPPRDRNGSATPPVHRSPLPHPPHRRRVIEESNNSNSASDGEVAEKGESVRSPPPQSSSSPRSARDSPIQQDGEKERNDASRSSVADATKNEN